MNEPLSELPVPREDMSTDTFLFANINALEEQLLATYWQSVPTEEFPQLRQKQDFLAGMVHGLKCAREAVTGIPGLR